MVAASLHSLSLSLYKYFLLGPLLYFSVQTYRELLRLNELEHQVVQWFLGALIFVFVFGKPHKN